MIEDGADISQSCVRPFCASSMRFVSFPKRVTWLTTHDDNREAQPPDHRIFGLYGGCPWFWMTKYSRTTSATYGDAASSIVTSYLSPEGRRLFS